MKFKEVKKLSKEDRSKKIKELKLELAKSKIKGKEIGGKAKNIRKVIARIMTLDNLEKGVKK